MQRSTVERRLHLAMAKWELATLAEVERASRGGAMQEVKHFEQNTDKIEKLESRAKLAFGTDGLFRGQIQAAIARSLDNYAARLQAAEDGMRLAIWELSKHDPLQRSPIPTEFWLLVHRHKSRRAIRLLDDPRVVVIEEKAFRELRLYQLRCEQ